jgi:Zn-dependent protease with chaperone function
MNRWFPGLVVAFTLAPGFAAAASVEKLDGYAEWREAGALVVDGQRVVPGAGMEVKGGKSFAQIPLGYEVKVTGTRNAEGVIVAQKIEAKRNGEALFENDLRQEFDKTEQMFRKRGRVFEEGEDGEKDEDLGALVEEGPDVDRVRGIVDRLVPPYMQEQEFRVYVVRNKDWNAFAAPNDSIYVYTGLLKALDDDELAIVLGHELVHATHEHSRKEYKKQLPYLLAAAAVSTAAEGIHDKGVRVGTQVGAFLVATMLSSGYGRGQEDQADRVGLRYAYEGGFDVSKGPRLWERFAQKFGDDDKVVNFFFGDHSRSSVRASNLRRQIQLNYQ